MNHQPVLPQRSPRLLKIRGLEKWYLKIIAFIEVIFILFFCYLGFKFDFYFDYIFSEYYQEILIFLGFFVFGLSYFLAKRKWFDWHSVQLVDGYLNIKKNHGEENCSVDKIERLQFSRPTKIILTFPDNKKIYLNPKIERLDYLWEGLYLARPDLFVSKEWFEEKRIKIIQSDHHYRRQEWFFENNFFDWFNWLILPVLLIFIGYTFQSQTIYIHHQSIYFLRLIIFVLFMVVFSYVTLTLLMKKFFFDKLVKNNLESGNGNKLRDRQNERLYFKKINIGQGLMTVLMFSMMLVTDLNFYSLTKPKSSLAFLSLNQSQTFIIDSRFNCIDCRYPLITGHKILLSGGKYGVILAVGGETMTFIKGQGDTQSRNLASEEWLKVPEHHVMLKMGESSRDVEFVPLTDIIGLIKNP